MEAQTDSRGVTTRRVPADDGVELHCETRGRGEPLLVVQGGISEAGATDQLAARLAEEFLVVSYDRRGLSRSPAPDRPTAMARHAADAAAVLAAVADRPAHVLGASIGALIALHLAVARPDAVATVVAHEPPMAAVVREPDREAGLDRVAATAEHDVFAAIGEMAALIGGTGEREPGAVPGAAVGDVGGNLHRFFRNDFAAVRTSTLTAGRVAELDGRVRVVPTGGQLSRQGWEYRCARELAAALGRPLVELPGGHDALTTHPTGVAELLVGLVDP